MIEPPLPPTAPLVEAVRAIESSHRRMAVVADAGGRLCGTLTDGDVRRCLLRGGSLETPVADAMNPEPLTAREGTSVRQIVGLMRRRHVMAVPITDAEGRYLRLVHLTDIATDRDAPGDGRAGGFAFAVIMAGGEGRRLRPLTENIPKPMVDIGGAPLLERQVMRLVRAGVRRVYLSVNYLGHVIESHFGDGGRFGVEIRYLKEPRKLGTAGALSLLPERPAQPILVMNGDIVTTSDFGSLLAFHGTNAAAITLSAVDHHVHIPFGVIRAEGARVVGLEEKPAQRFLCNAGIYCLSPAALDRLPVDRVCDMPDLVHACLAAGDTVAVFPMHEYWSDIGTPDDLARARAFFAGREAQDA